MDNKVTQWISEIQSLQQQLAQLNEDLAAAESSAQHWRDIYTREAKQRRDEAQVAQEQIEQLNAHLQRLQNPSKPSATQSLNAAQQEVEQLPVDQLRPKLIDRMVECEHLHQEVSCLSEALKAEQESHARTRTDLTTALGDTVSLLTQAKTGEASPTMPQFLAQLQDEDNHEGEEQVLETPSPLVGTEDPKQIAPSSERPLPQLPASKAQGSS